MNPTLELSNLRIDCGFKDAIIIEKSVVHESIIQDGKQYAFVDDDLGYTEKTALNLIRKHCNSLRGRHVIVRRGPSGGLYDAWGLYVSLDK